MVSALLIGIIGSVIASIIWNEADAWGPRLSQLLLERAVRRLPTSKQDRYREEWEGYLDDMPTSLSKVFAALGFRVAAEAVIYPPRLRLRYTLDKVVVASTLLAMLPAMVMISLIVLITLGRPVVYRARRRSGDRDVDLFMFRTAPLAADGPPAPSNFGRFLRRSGLNNLPQLLNVLRGDLTYLGPRPLPPHLADAVQRQHGGPPPTHLERAGLSPIVLDHGEAYNWLSDRIAEEEHYRSYVENWSLKAEALVAVTILKRGYWLIWNDLRKLRH